MEREIKKGILTFVIRDTDYFSRRIVNCYGTGNGELRLELEPSGSFVIPYSDIKNRKKLLTLLLTESEQRMYVDGCRMRLYIKLFGVEKEIFKNYPLIYGNLHTKEGIYKFRNGHI